MSKKNKSKEPKVKKEKTAEDKAVVSQILKSATAVICAAAVGIAFSSSVGKLSEAKIKAAELSASSAQTASGENSGENTSSEGAYEESAVPSADETAAGEEETADTGSESETPAAEESSTPAAESPAKDTAAKKDTNGAPQTKAEIVAYCNKALNDAKAAKVGYTKKFVRGGGDNLPAIVTKVLEANKTTTAKKGDSGIVDDFPAAGFSWSSKLRESDVASADLKQNGQYYEITLKLGKENNPAKGEASSYGRVMSVIDANDAKEMLSAIKSINMTYHDGYVYAKIDSKTGKLVKAEFSASADISATLAVIGDLSAKNIKSTETFTDIQW